MSKEFAKSLGKVTTIAAGIGAAAGVAESIAVTWEHHRRKTHQSLEPHPVVTKAAEFVESTIGVESTSWASVHRLHHHFADASLKPFLDIMRAIEWLEEHQDVDVTIPDMFPHLDPYVEAFSREDVVAVGGHARESLKQQMGDAYLPPESYSVERLEELLNPQAPRYYYEMEPPKKDGDYSYDEIETILTRDPHTPVLVPPDKQGNQNGLRSVYKNNVPFFKHPRNLFKKHPEYKPDDLQADEPSTVRVIANWTAGFVASAGIVYAARRDFTKKGALIAAIAGSVGNAARIPSYLNGGKITNGYGHGGPMTEEELAQAVFTNNYLPELNDDGSVGTDTVRAGILGKVLSMLTLDEVGGQGAHHDAPENIAYTKRTGWGGALDAPFGTVTRKIAESRLPFLTKGKQFGGVAKEDRPDMPNPGVLLIQDRRVQQRDREAQPNATV